MPIDTNSACEESVTEPIPFPDALGLLSAKLSLTHRPEHVNLYTFYTWGEKKKEKREKTVRLCVCGDSHRQHCSFFLEELASKTDLQLSISVFIHLLLQFRLLQPEMCRSVSILHVSLHVFNVVVFMPQITCCDLNLDSCCGVGLKVSIRHHALV